MVTVSIALATFNGAEFLSEQLDSIQAQTFSDFELIASDDASDDGTWEILERRAAGDPRMRIMRNTSRKGVQRNFESVISAASGDWIAPCDQDDIWEEDKLAVLLDAARASGSILAYSDSVLVDGEGQPLGKNAFQTMVALDGKQPLYFAFSNWISGHAMLFHRRLLDVALPFPDVPLYDWWLAIASTSIGEIICVDRALVRHRQHGANVTNMAGLKKKTPKQGEHAPAWSVRDRLISARFESFSVLPGHVGGAYKELSSHWERRRSQYFAFSLARFAWKNRNDLWAVRPVEPKRILSRCAKFAIGRRWHNVQQQHP